MGGIPVKDFFVLLHEDKTGDCTITMCSWSGGQPAVLVFQKGRTGVSQCLFTYLIAQIICIIAAPKVLKLILTIVILSSVLLYYILYMFLTV